MKRVHSMELNTASREEQLPGLHESFPYIATRAELDQYDVSWHWHRAAELFYVQSGCLEYITPSGSYIFPAGSGGFVNTNVLHTSQVQPSREPSIQLLHLFDPSLLSGGPGTRMEQKYVLPLCTAPVDIIPLYADNPVQASVLEQILNAFSIPETRMGYEFLLRDSLCRIWLDLLQLAQPMIQEETRQQNHDVQIKALMVYIQEHFQEPISIYQLANAAHISRRLCFQLFQDKLHMTPLAYIRLCRLQYACRLLRSSDLSITEIAYACGFSSGSYLGKQFRSQFGCSPLDYRKSAQSSHYSASI